MERHAPSSAPESPMGSYECVKLYEQILQLEDDGSEEHGDYGNGNGMHDGDEGDGERGAARAAQTFIPAASFCGAKPGFVFKLGTAGVGYYGHYGHGTEAPAEDPALEQEGGDDR